MRSDKFFDCTDRERATFEAGIKLSSLYHQYIGAPVNLNNVEYFERAMEEGMKVQPYVKDAMVRIDREILSSALSDYGYCSLNERMFHVEVEISLKGILVKASLSWVDELNYPLMRVNRIEP